MKILKQDDKQILAEDDKGNVVVYNQSGHFDRQKLLQEKWLLLENKPLPHERVIHIMQIEQQTHAEVSYEEVIDQQVAKIDEKIAALDSINDQDIQRT